MESHDENKNVIMARDGAGDPFRAADQGGQMAVQAELARLGYVGRACVAQIMNLPCLAPDIQDAILFSPPTVKGRDTIREHPRRLAAERVSKRRKRRYRIHFPRTMRNVKRRYCQKLLMRKH